MKLLAFSVFDRAVEAFLPPFFVRHRGEALRSFIDACNDRSHQFSKHVLDYTLMFVGEFDDTRGAFDQLSDPVRVVSATECLGDGASSESAVALGASAAGRVPSFSDRTKVG